MARSRFRVPVEAHAGARGAETPRAFRLHGARVEVTAVLRRWIEEDAAGRRRERRFAVRGSDGEERVLAYDEALAAWFLIGASG